jgi:hypothetical protein
MFTDEFIRLHIQKVTLRTEERKKDERFPVFAVGLVLEPLTYSQAKQLGGGVLNHCFTDKKQVRPEMTEVTVALNEPEQCLIARMAEDVEEDCRLRQVRVRKIKIAKRDASDEAGERKSKKIAPRQPTLRATFECLIDSAEKVHQQFLCRFFAQTMYFTFQPEQGNLFTGIFTETDDDDDQGELEGHAPAADPDAADVLDDAKPSKRSRGPKLVKKATNGSGKHVQA